jgi:hypothetical protein
MFAMRLPHGNLQIIRFRHSGEGPGAKAEVRNWLKHLNLVACRFRLGAVGWCASEKIKFWRQTEELLEKRLIYQNLKGIVTFVRQRVFSYNLMKTFNIQLFNWSRRAELNR